MQNNGWINGLNEWDKRFVERLSSYEVSPFVKSVLNFYTRLGDGWIWGIVGLIVFTVLPWQVAFATLREAALTGVLSILVYKNIKSRVKRRRPYAQLGDQNFAVDPLDEYSFPSGHTMNNLAVGLALWNYIPWLGVALMGVALSWGLLRVWFRVHFITDVAFGALFAFGLGQIGHILNTFLLGWIPWPS